MLGGLFRPSPSLRHNEAELSRPEGSMSRYINRFPTQFCRSGMALLSASLLMMMTPGANAQEGRCAPNAGATANLDLVRLADNDKTRAVAASSLISDWRGALPTECLNSRRPAARSNA